MNRLPTLNINRHTWRFLKNSRCAERVRQVLQNTVHQGHRTGKYHAACGFAADAKQPTRSSTDSRAKKSAFWRRRRDWKTTVSRLGDTLRS